MTLVYTEIEFELGSTLDKAIELLQKYHKDGKQVKGTFNNVILYSDTVTPDKAYLAVTGKTKAEFEKEESQRHKEYREKMDKHKLAIPSLTKKWINKGYMLLNKDKWETWRVIVPIRLNDLYCGMELGACLDIIELLNNDNLKAAKQKFKDQEHSGTSAYLVASMIYELHDKHGKEFAIMNGFKVS